MSEQGSLTTIGEFLNVSTLDPLLPTFLIATLCLCTLSVITYYSLVVAWEVFWASQQSPLPLDPSAEVVLTGVLLPWTVLVTNCSPPLLYVTNPLYNFSDLAYDKLNCVCDM